MQNVTKAQTARILTRMQQRIAAVQAVRAAKNEQRRERAKRAQFAAELQKLAEQFGMPVPSVSIDLHARANSATVAPSNPLIVVNGEALKPCKAVHALCAQLVQREPQATRAQMLQLCKDNGINSATASTQVGIFRKQQAEALAAPQEETEQ